MGEIRQDNGRDDRTMGEIRQLGQWERSDKTMGDLTGQWEIRQDDKTMEEIKWDNGRDQTRQWERSDS